MRIYRIHWKVRSDRSDGPRVAQAKVWAYPFFGLAEGFDAQLFGCDRSTWALESNLKGHEHSPVCRLPEILKRWSIELKPSGVVDAVEARRMILVFASEFRNRDYQVGVRSANAIETIQ